MPVTPHSFRARAKRQVVLHLVCMYVCVYLMSASRSRQDTSMTLLRYCSYGASTII
jgi:hypothetical protein